MATDDGRSAERVSSGARGEAFAGDVSYREPAGLNEFLSETQDDPIELPTEPIEPPAPRVELHIAPRPIEPEAPPAPFHSTQSPPAGAIAPAEPVAPVRAPIAIVERPASEPTAARTLADVIDRGEPLDWRDAVGIVHALCVEVRRFGHAGPVVIDPRNIEIGPDGDVRLLRAPVGGDAVVTQLGRLLKALVAGVPVPPELRLLVSQTTFEVPILESVDQMAHALSEVGGFRDRHLVPGSVSHPRGAIAALEMPRREADGATVRPALPSIMPQRPHRRTLFARARASGYWQEALLVASLVIGLTLMAGLVISRTSRSGPRLGAPVTATTPSTATPAPKPVATPTAPAASAAGPTVLERLTSPRVGAGAPPRAAARPELPPVSGTAGSPAPPKPAPNAVRSVRPPPDRAPETASPRESERRAAALVADGQSDQAAIAFDAIVMSNPLYEPTRTELTPEAFAAFQKSRASLLPVIAMRDYNRARASLEAGNVDRALAEGNQAMALLDRIESNPPPNLREQLTELIDKASLAKIAADEIIYSRINSGVVPPRPLSRQFPVTTPYGIPPSRVGVLEMVIGKQGDVEFVKLHAPLNRYHERMVVSAAKAWRYRPATKDGKPVRYRLSVTINLPESGTDQ